LGMTVHTIVVNKIQPDPLGAHESRFTQLSNSAKARAAFVGGAAKATGEPAALIEAIVEAAEFGRVRHAMNLEYIEELQRRLPKVPLVLLPLFKQDVQGLERLDGLEAELFRAANARVPK